MLYLAELKKTKGFIGGIKTELKLIASQGKDKSWSVVSKETTIATEESNNFGDGALVVVTLDQNQEIQGKIEPATGRVLKILQSFSRLLVKSKEQEQEIDQWRQSLQIQMEELSQREIELQTNLSQIAQVAAFNDRHGNSDNYQQQLQQQTKALSQATQKVDRQQMKLKNCQEQFEKSLASVEETKTQLLVKENIFRSQQESLELLNQELRTKEELQERISRLAIESGSIELDDKVNIHALENMPLGELQEIVNKLKEELGRIVRFVNEQEEELTLQCQTIQELEDGLGAANEYDRLNLEQELLDEKERKKMLDQTLVGQRRTLRERQEILRQHLRILERRQGIISTDWEDQVVNLKPILLQLKNQHNSLVQKKSELESEIGQIEEDIDKIKNTLAEQEKELNNNKQDLQQQQEECQQAKISVAELQSQVKIYEEIVQPMQANLNEIKEKFEALGIF
ncbi:MAG: pilus motility taxis protein HmpF [Prochloraceae cyanobacterium]|nr:pilus motility taxis protein HmpF [Prochloraceae cyanobacterium]